MEHQETLWNMIYDGQKHGTVEHRQLHGQYMENDDTPFSILGSIAYSFSRIMMERDTEMQSFKVISTYHITLFLVFFFFDIGGINR